MIPAIEYTTNDEKTELYGFLQERLKPVLPTDHELNSLANTVISETLGPLEELSGNSLAQMPQVAFVEIRGHSGNSYVSLIRNNAHLNITSMFGEKKFRAPQEDTLSVVPGFLGTYPNVFLTAKESDLGRFVSLISTMRNEEDYSNFLDNYGVRRTSPEFWQQSDAFHAAYQQDAPVEFGLFDYSRLENR